MNILNLASTLKQGLMFVVGLSNKSKWREKLSLIYGGSQSSYRSNKELMIFNFTRCICVAEVPESPQIRSLPWKGYPANNGRIFMEFVLLPSDPEISILAPNISKPFSSFTRLCTSFYSDFTSFKLSLVNHWWRVRPKNCSLSLAGARADHNETKLETVFAQRLVQSALSSSWISTQPYPIEIFHDSKENRSETAGVWMQSTRSCAREIRVIGKIAMIKPRLGMFLLFY